MVYLQKRWLQKWAFCAGANASELLSIGTNVANLEAACPVISRSRQVVVEDNQIPPNQEAHRYTGPRHQRIDGARCNEKKCELEDRLSLALAPPFLLPSLKHL